MSNNASININNNNNQNSENIVVIQLNVNSIRSIDKRHQLELFLKQNKPNILLCSETHLNERHKLHFNEYNIYRNDRVSSGGGGGTAIFVNKNIACERIVIPNELKSIECCAIKMKTIDGSKLVLFSIYKPPTSKLVVSELTKLFRLEQNAKVMIAGDFNAHNKLWNSHKNCATGNQIEKWYYDNKDTLNIQIFSTEQPTCFRGENPSNIDFAIISDDIVVSNSSSLNTVPTKMSFSDHAAIVYRINSCQLIQNKKTMIKNFDKTMWVNFNTFVDSKIDELKIPVNCNMSTNSIDNFANKLQNIFIEAVSKFVPNIEINCNTVNISNQSKALIKKKKTILRKRHRNRNSPEYKRILSELRMINTMIHSSIVNDYKHFWENKIKNIRIDNNIYKQIKSLSTYKSKSSMPDVIENDMNEKFVSDREKSEALAHQFASTQSLTINNQSIYEEIVNENYEIYNKNVCIFNFSEIFPANFKDKNIDIVENTNANLFLSTSDLKSIIKSRNNKKSFGCDCLPNYALKRMSPKFFEFVTIFMNHITNQQHIPAAWKLGIVTPIPKPGKDAKKLSNWRPITQVPAISKVYEKHIDTQIRRFCDTNNIFDDNQFGFRPQRSTTLAAAKFLNQVIEGLNNKTPTFAVLLDLRAAFDVIWHKALIYKLHQMGFGPIMIRIICNYLKDRFFAVKVSDEMSIEYQIIAGCPQGTILAATLFILFMNDFPKMINAIINVKRMLYADDILIFSTSKNANYAQSVMNSYLSDVNKYIYNWKLELSIGKCESITFVGHYKDLQQKIRKAAKNVRFKIDQTVIEHKENVKYLGITFSSNLQFNRHIDNILLKVNAAQNQLSNIFKNKLIDSSIKTLAYSQLIRALMLYACPVWAIVSMISSAQIERLRIKERWFLRHCLSMFRDPTTNKYYSSQILYQLAKINRIDREIVKKNMKFIDKSTESHNIFHHSNEYFDKHKYKPLEYYNNCHTRNKLYTSGNLLIFNRSRRNENRTVYVTSQNTVDR